MTVTCVAMAASGWVVALVLCVKYIRTLTALANFWMATALRSGNPTERSAAEKAYESRAWMRENFPRVTHWLEGH